MLVIVIVAFDVLVSGYLKFGYYVIKCGGVPVALDDSRFAARTPTYQRPYRYIPGWASTNYVCTVKDAVDSGHIESIDSIY